MSLVVRIVAPTGRDAEMICSVLLANQVPAQVSSSALLSATEFKADPLGPLLIAEEALQPTFIEHLGGLIRDQPSWSDLPIMILTGNGRETAHTRSLEREWLPLGAPILLERPIRTATLVSSVRAALRARAKQYQIRDAIAELKQERETLQVVLDNLPVGVVVARASGEIILGNRRLESILRHPLIPTPDIDGHGAWTAYHPDGRRVQAEEFPLPRAMKTGRALPTEEFLYQRGDGTQGWVALTAAPILNTAGEVTGGVVALSDIDQQKKSESALIQNEKLAAVGRLAASISHEINNPLEAVTNLLYLARLSPVLTDEVRGYLDIADHELARVSQIVSHTLRFHRQSTRPRSMTAKELLEPSLGLYAGRIANAGVVLSVEHGSGEAITCYEGEIRQVLNNLISNAIEAMKMGGRLIVRSGRTRSWKTGRVGVRITIADTGHGMPKEVQARLFEAFYTTKGENGTGLGLWISRGIVEKHFGSLRMRSSVRPGSSGSVFRVFLPADPFLGSAPAASLDEVQAGVVRLSGDTAPATL